MSLHTLGAKLTDEWQRLLGYGALFAGFGTLLWYKLGTLPGGYSPAEQATAISSGSWSLIFREPLNAPFLAVVQGLSYLHDDRLFVTRLMAAACGLITIMIFYGLVRHWHGERAALFGTILFGVSAWLMHTARLGTPDVLLYGVLALVACGVWLKHTASRWALLAGFILVAALLYVPGMVWFIALGIAWQWRAIDRHFKRHLWVVTAGGFLLIAALTPLGLAVYHNPDLAKTLAGLPQAGWPVPLEVVKNLAFVPYHLFVSGPINPERWLGTIPIIDYFTAAMFLLGGCLYLRHIRLGRFWLLLAIGVIGTVLASLGGLVTLTAIIPFIYLVAAAGIGVMLDRWVTVFPRNVIAQSVGYGLMAVAILAVSIYSVRHYFVAWPQAGATKARFIIQSRTPSDTMKQ